MSNPKPKKRSVEEKANAFYVNSLNVTVSDRSLAYLIRVLLYITFFLPVLSTGFDRSCLEAKPSQGCEIEALSMQIVHLGQGLSYDRS